MIVKFNVYCLAAATTASVAAAIGLHNKPHNNSCGPQLQQQPPPPPPPQLQQLQPQQQSQQQQTKEEKHVDSKSYLDSDITSIFSNRKNACTQNSFVTCLEPPQ